MLTVYNRVNYKIERAVHKYRRAREALLVLDPDGSWKQHLLELRREDVRGPGKDEYEIQKGKGKLYAESWIWLTHRSGRNAREEEEEFNDDMRVEWVKSRARMMRWGEEYLLVQEEMCRVLVWHEWKAKWWESQVSLRVSADEDILKGVRAYAHKQAAVLRRMARRCAGDWLVVMRKHGVEPSWASDFVGLTPTLRRSRLRDLDANANAEEVVDDGEGVEMEVHSEDDESDDEAAADFDDFDFDD